MSDDEPQRAAGLASAAVAAGPPKVPTRRVAVVTCMDARIDPLAALGFELGDAHVIRNAGALVTDDVLRSLAISQALLGTRVVVVLAHTDCGLCGLDEDDFADELTARAGQRPAWSPGSFVDVDAFAEDGADRVRRCPFLRYTDDVRAAVFDVSTGQVRPTTGAGHG